MLPELMSVPDGVTLLFCLDSNPSNTIGSDIELIFQELIHKEVNHE